LIKGKQDQYLRTFCPTIFKDSCNRPKIFDRFLNEIFDNNSQLISYLQRLFGCGLIGAVREHILPIFWGVGRNGKDTLIQAISHVLGPMAAPVDVEILLEQKSARASHNPSPDIVDLRGRRIIWASETSQQRKLNAGKVKMLTGGNILKGRALFSNDFTEFSPTHMPVLITNHRPHAPANDYALWQRIHLIPFSLSFVDNPKLDHERQRDPHLPDKLESESSEILNWLVQGCLHYQKEGLNPPECVKMATDDYRQSEDIVGHFIEDRCRVQEIARCKASDLYTAYKDWCIGNGHHSMNQKNFALEIKDRFDSYKSGTIYYVGIDLNDD